MTTAARTPFHITIYALLMCAILILIALPDRAEAAMPADFKLGVALEYPSSLASFENTIGRKTGMFLWYQSIGESLDTGTLGPIAAGGRTIELAWEPWWFGASDLVNQPAYRLENITRGDFDAEIRRWAREMKAFGYPIIFRPMSEMNGDWTSWAGTVNGNTPDDYAPAFRHVHDIIVQEGAANVKFLWSPNRDGDVSSAAYTFITYYPGDAYVDYIGIDGYNWGTMYKTSNWTSSWQMFEQVFGPSYDAFSARSLRPVIISETASTESGGDKAAWITDAFTKLPVRFPRVVGLTWFNYNKETDWRVESSAASATAFRNAVAIVSIPEPAPAPDPAPAPPPASLDVTPPSVGIASPLDGNVLSQRVRFEVDATDNVAVTRVELFIGNRLMFSDTSAPYAKWVRTKQLPNGVYTVTAKAYDAAGNVGIKQIMVTIKN